MGNQANRGFSAYANGSAVISTLLEKESPNGIKEMHPKMSTSEIMLQADQALIALQNDPNDIDAILDLSDTIFLLSEELLDPLSGFKEEIFEPFLKFLTPKVWEDLSVNRLNRIKEIIKDDFSKQIDLEYAFLETNSIFTLLKLCLNNSPESVTETQVETLIHQIIPITLRTNKVPSSLRSLIEHLRWQIAYLNYQTN